MNERKDHIEPDASTELEQAKINLETAKIAWQELQRFFAAGQAFFVSADLDLTEVALKMSQDNAEYIETLIASEKISLVKDDQAKKWIEQDALVWCVVVKPYILVQAVY